MSYALQARSVIRLSTSLIESEISHPASRLWLHFDMRPDAVLSGSLHSLNLAVKEILVSGVESEYWHDLIDEALISQGHRGVLTAWCDGGLARAAEEMLSTLPLDEPAIVTFVPPFVSNKRALEIIGGVSLDLARLLALSG